MHELAFTVTAHVIEGQISTNVDVYYSPYAPLQVLFSYYEVTRPLLRFKVGTTIAIRMIKVLFVPLKQVQQN